MDDLLEPYKAYDSYLKEEFKKNTIKYFDDLVKESKIDINSNRLTVNKYKDALKKANDFKKDANKYKILWRFVLILSIALSIFLLILAFAYKDNVVALTFSILGIFIIVILLILFRLLYIKNKYNHYNDIINKKIIEAEMLKQEAYKQMYNLNLLYDWNIPAKIVKMTSSLIQMDDYFDVSKFQFLHDRYGFLEQDNLCISTKLVQSGSILGNPFLIIKEFEQGMYEKEYEGSTIVTYTVRTKNGLVTRSEIVHAYYTHPAPMYGELTYLVYGNEAAPHLIFSRSPSGADKLNQKQVDKKIKKTVKELDKKAYRELVDNDDTTNYQRIDNDEFEVLFGGTDRNDELEYRLLFTPLAQYNLLELIKSKKYYGDDFNMNKDKKLNYGWSHHSQKFDYNADPSIFMHYDYDKARAFFIDYNINYFQNFFFDLLPLLSIPLYQQTKTKEYMYDMPYKSNLTSYEQEVLANNIDPSYFMPDDAITPVILKAEYDEMANNKDKIKINAYAFKGIEKVAHVIANGPRGPVSVAVPYIDYIPVSKTTPMMAAKTNISRRDYLNSVASGTLSKLAKDSYRFERGLLAIIGGVNGNDVSPYFDASLVNQTKDDIINTVLINEIVRGINKAKDTEKLIEEYNLKEKKGE